MSKEKGNEKQINKVIIAGFIIKTGLNYANSTRIRMQPIALTKLKNK